MATPIENKDLIPFPAREGDPNVIVKTTDEEDNIALRKLLWLRHGCPVSALYGDDGEMQCPICMIDFLRDSPEQIESVFLKKTEKWIEEHKVEVEQVFANANIGPFKASSEDLNPDGGFS